MDERVTQSQPLLQVHLLILQVLTNLQRSLAVEIADDVDEALLLSDEILVMGSTPGRIIARHQLPQEKPRSLSTLALPALTAMKADILTLLDEEEHDHEK